MTADRFDKGKPQLHYVDTFDEALDGVAKVSEYGASKYAPYNYLKGAKAATESYNCARRHMKAWLNGEDLVPDAVAAGFDVHHIDAAIWNLMRLRQELVDFPERDDRPHKVLASQPQREFKVDPDNHYAWGEQAVEVEIMHVVPGNTFMGLDTHCSYEDKELCDICDCLLKRRSM